MTTLSQRFLSGFTALTFLATSLLLPTAPVYGVNGDTEEAFSGRSLSRTHFQEKLPAAGEEITQVFPSLMTMVKGLAQLAYKGVKFALEHPGQALTLALAAQVAATNAITPLTDDFLINQNTTNGQGFPSVAVLNNSNTFVVWQGNQAGTNDISGRLFYPNGTALGNELTINQMTAGEQTFPSLAALSNGNAFIVWQGGQTGTYDIYGRVLASNGTSLGNEFTINQMTAGGQVLPSLAALSNGNTFVVWYGDQTGSYDVYGRVVAPNGTSLTNEITLNQVATGNQADPKVAAFSNGNAFVIWNGDQTGNWDIYGRLLASNGTTLTNDLTLNQGTTGSQIYSSVATLSNANVFVVWQGNQAGAYDIYGRVFAPNGTALSNEFTINQVIAGIQYKPSVAALSNGNAFVAWRGDQTGNWDIYGRVMAPNGTALTNDFTINQNIAGDQYDPSVVALSNSNAFVVWYGNQTGTYDIYGRIFDFSDPVTTTGLQTTSLQTTGLLTTAPFTTDLQTTNALQSTAGLQTTKSVTSSHSPAPYLLPFILGTTTAAVAGTCFGVSLMGACVAGVYGAKKYHHKRQQNKPSQKDSGKMLPLSQVYGTPRTLNDELLQNSRYSSAIPVRELQDKPPQDSSSMVVREQMRTPLSEI